MTLKDLIAADVSVFLNTDDFADSITYREPDGAETSCTAVIYDSLTEQRDVRGIATIVTTRNVTVSNEDIPVVNMRGLVIISDVEWSISQVIYDDGTLKTLELQRHELHENTRPNYRRQ
jgi:hypothetical protein